MDLHEDELGSGGADSRTVRTATGTIKPVMKKILITVHFYRD